MDMKKDYTEWGGLILQMLQTGQKDLTFIFPD